MIPVGVLNVRRKWQDVSHVRRRRRVLRLRPRQTLPKILSRETCGRDSRIARRFLANRVQSPNAIRMPPNFFWRLRLVSGGTLGLQFGFAGAVLLTVGTMERLTCGQEAWPSRTYPFTEVFPAEPQGFQDARPAAGRDPEAARGLPRRGRNRSGQAVRTMHRKRNG